MNSIEIVSSTLEIIFIMVSESLLFNLGNVKLYNILNIDEIDVRQGN